MEGMPIGIKRTLTEYQTNRIYCRMVIENKVRHQRHLIHGTEPTSALHI